MTLKICNKCKEAKFLEFFFKDKNNKTDGRYSICKTCKHKSVIDWRNNNKAHYNSYMRQKNKEQYPIDRLRRYGITIEQHKEMLLLQDNRCAICKKSPPTKRPLCVDHRHSDNEVRGLLCYGCNRLLKLIDTEGLLQKAAEYDLNPPARKILIKP